MEAGAGSMNAKGEIEFPRLFVERIKVGIAEYLLVHNAAHEKPACPAFPRKIRLCESRVHIQKRHCGNPTKTASRRPAEISQPAIVAPAESDIDFWATGQSAEKERRIENLNVDLQLVHVPKPCFHIAHLPNGRRYRLIDVDAPGEDSSVDEPELSPAFLSHHGGLKLPLRAFHRFPRALGFDHMSIGIDSGHLYPPEKYEV